MSSFLCFICHSTIHSDTSEEIREKYRELIGIHLCPDSHLCHICCHVLNKMWLFKSVCLKRGLEYPVLFSERGTMNLQQSYIELYNMCPQGNCCDHPRRNLNSKTYDISHNIYDDYNTGYCTNSDNLHYNDGDGDEYVKLAYESNNFDDFLFKNNITGLTNSSEVHTESNSNAVSNIKHCNNEIKNSESICEHKIIDEENNEYDKFNGHTSDLHTDQFDVNNPEDLEEITQNSNDNLDVDKFHDQSKDDDIDVIANSKENNDKDTDSKIEMRSKSKINKGFKKIILSREEQKAELESKRKEKKYVEAEFKCYNCALGFLFKDTYQAHMMRHEESNGEYRCDACGLRFAACSVLRAHERLHRERWRCTRCELTVARRRRCVRCGVVGSGDREPAACHLCGELFVDSSGLQQHLKRFHAKRSGNRTYACNVCGQRCTSQAAVRTHMVKHINRKFACDTCPSTFSSPYTLNEHKKKHARPPERHACAFCGATYASRKSLVAHLRRVNDHQLALFECCFCERVCPNRQALTSHIQTVHSASKDHACPHCTARYTTRKSLVRHLRIHATTTNSHKRANKTAVCHLCGNSFSSNNKLKRHLREVCEKAKLEEQLAALLDVHDTILT